MNELKTYEDAISPVAMMSDQGMMDRMLRFAEVMATGKSTIPPELRNVGDCMAITMQAMSWKMNPFSVAQKAFFIGGRIGFEAQLVAAAINNSGAVDGTFHFEWYGPWENVIGKFEIKRGDKGEYRVPGWVLADEQGIGIKCWATLKGESEPRVLDLLLAQARTRNSTLWADDPRQQLAYLAQKRWARLYAPGVILGVYTPDELDNPSPRDMGTIDRTTGEVTPPGKPSLPTCPDAKLDKWIQNVREGKAQADELLPFAQGKHTLTAEQIERVTKFVADIKSPPIDGDFVKQMESEEQK